MPSSAPINLLIVNTLYAPHKKGGAEVSVQRVAEYLANAGHQVTVLTLSPDVQSEDKINGVNVIRWPIFNHYSVFDYDEKKPSFVSKLLWQIKDSFNLKVYQALRKLIQQRQFDVVWTNNLSGFSISVWAACRAQQLPVVHTVRDYYLLSNNVQLYAESKGCLAAKGVIPWLKQRLLNRYSKALHGFVGISDAILALHTKHAQSLDKIGKTIFNSVNIASNSNQTTHTERLKPTFGFMGQITESKGVFDLFDSLLTVNADAQLLIAGNVTDAIRKKYQYPQVTFIGHVQPQDFYPQIDGLLVPSKWLEPFGRVVIEAIANNTPVLCADKGGLSELAAIFDSVQLYDFAAPSVPWKSAMPIFNHADLEVVKTKFSDEAIGGAYESLLLSARHKAIHNE